LHSTLHVLWLNDGFCIDELLTNDGDEPMSVFNFLRTSTSIKRCSDNLTNESRLRVLDLFYLWQIWQSSWSYGPNLLFLIWNPAHEADQLRQGRIDEFLSGNSWLSTLNWCDESEVTISINFARTSNFFIQKVIVWRFFRASKTWFHVPQLPILSAPHPINEQMCEYPDWIREQDDFMPSLDCHPIFSNRKIRSHALIQCKARSVRLFMTPNARRTSTIEHDMKWLEAIVPPSLSHQCRVTESWTLNTRLLKGSSLFVIGPTDGEWIWRNNSQREFVCQNADGCSVNSIIGFIVFCEISRDWHTYDPIEATNQFGSDSSLSMSHRPRVSSSWSDYLYDTCFPKSSCLRKQTFVILRHPATDKWSWNEHSQAIAFDCTFNLMMITKLSHIVKL
jgi:hypothetical protein